MQTLFDEWDADADGSLSFLEFESGVNLFISTTTQPLPGDVEETRTTRAMVHAVFQRLGEFYFIYRYIFISCESC